LRPARAFFSRNIQRSDLDLLAVYRKSIDELADRSVGSRGCSNLPSIRLLKAK